jgi:excisionase family DNA binding protein
MDLSYEFSELRKELTEIRELLKSKLANSDTPKMYDLVDLQEILNVSRRTIATWTKEGILEYVKVGNKLWITEKQLSSFLEDNSSDANNDLK